MILNNAANLSTIELNVTKVLCSRTSMVTNIITKFTGLAGVIICRAAMRLVVLIEI